MRDLKAILIEKSASEIPGRTLVTAKVSGRKRHFSKERSRWSEHYCGGSNRNLPPNLIKALNAIV